MNISNGAAMARKTPAAARTAPIAPCSPLKAEKHGASGARPGAPNGAANGAFFDIDAETVIYRLEEAGRTLLALPNTGYSTRMRTSQIDIVRSAMEAYGWDTGRLRPAYPDAAQVSRMDQALAWIPMIPADRYVLRRIVGARALVSPTTERHLFAWRRLAKLLGADHKAIQRWHAQGIDMIVAMLRVL